MEVVARSGEDGIDGVAMGASQMVVAHTVLVLDVADDGHDGGAAAHFALDGGRYSSLLT